MKILYFVAYPQRLAGANRCLLDILKGLASDMVPVVVSVGEGRMTEACREHGFKTIVLTPSGPLTEYGRAALRWSTGNRAFAVGHLALYTARMLRLLREERIDLIHTNDWRGTLLIGPAAKLLRVPVVAHHRGQRFGGGLYWNAFERLSDRVITVCKALIQEFSPTVQPRCRAVYDGFDADIVTSGATIPWLDSVRARGGVVLTCFATLVPFKGHHHLLAALAELARRDLGRELVLVCVGDIADPAYYEWLLEESRRLGLNNVTFAGWTSDPYVFYRSSDVSVMISVSKERLTFHGRTLDVRGGEGFPRTHLEAMTHLLPVVGTDVAGVTEQIDDGVTGFVVPPGDAVSAARALEKLILDPALRGRMGQAGRERVKRLFSDRSNLEGVLSVYREMTPHSVEC